jgi:hypothetical protein
LPRCKVESPPEARPVKTAAEWEELIVVSELCYFNSIFRSFVDKSMLISNTVDGKASVSLYAKEGNGLD